MCHCRYGGSNRLREDCTSAFPTWREDLVTHHSHSTQHQQPSDDRIAKQFHLAAWPCSSPTHKLKTRVASVIEPTPPMTFSSARSARLPSVLSCCPRRSRRW